MLVLVLVLDSLTEIRSSSIHSARGSFLTGALRENFLKHEPRRSRK